MHSQTAGGRGRASSSPSCPSRRSWRASTCSSSTSRFNDIGRDFDGVSLGRPELGAERLRDRLRRVAGPAGPTRRPVRPQGRLPARPGHLHAGQRGLCGQHRPWLLVFFRVVQAAGAAPLTPTSLGLLLDRDPPASRAAGRPDLGGHRGDGGGRRSGRRRRAGRGAPGGGSSSSTCRSASRCSPPRSGWCPTRGTAASRMPDLSGARARVGDRRAGARSREGTRVGLGRGRTSWRPSSWPRSGRGVLAAQLHRHPVPVVEPALLRVRTFAWSNATALTLQHRVRRQPADRRAVDAERVGLLGAADRPGDRTGPADGADLRDRRPAAVGPGAGRATDRDRVPAAGRGQCGSPWRWSDSTPRLRERAAAGLADRGHRRGTGAADDPVGGDRGPAAGPDVATGAPWST